LAGGEVDRHYSLFFRMEWELRPFISPNNGLLNVPKAQLQTKGRLERRPFSFGQMCDAPLALRNLGVLLTT